MCNKRQTKGDILGGIDLFQIVSLVTTWTIISFVVNIG